MKIVQKDIRWDVIDGVDDTVLASFAEPEDASRYRAKKGDEKIDSAFLEQCRQGFGPFGSFLGRVTLPIVKVVYWLKYDDGLAHNLLSLAFCIVGAVATWKFLMWLHH